LASPEAAASLWVTREVEYWLAHKAPSKLLIAVTDGEIAWDRAAGDFDHDITTCIPANVYGCFDDEPRWVDLREARREEHISLRVPHSRDKVADLAAPLHGVVKDDLVGTDIQRHRATQRLVRATIATLAALTLLLGAATVVAINRTNTADQQRAVAQQQRAAVEQQRRLATALQLVARADLASVNGEPRTAAMLGLAAVHVDDNDETRAGLTRTSMGTTIDATLTGHTESVDSVAFAPDGHTLATAGHD